MKPSPALLLSCFLAACGSDAMQIEGGGPDAGMDPGPAPACEVPTVGLRAYLDQGTYKQFPVEPSIHPSAGPHFGNVRVYLNPLLDASLKSGAAEHPQCAAAVKELYGSGTTTLIGWSVSVKTGTRSNGGAGWYWYELASMSAGATPIAGQGVPLCTSCHGGGKDYVLTAPLR